ncbi:MAG: ATP-dependent DNA helicase RecG [SAR202 cluster bacterium]|nr:ATP-dependent DNA helicase RecG [SAR202 cluster bacterium]
MAMCEQGTFQSTKLNTFKNILEQELDSGFDDSVVIGGVDAFIDRWKIELSSGLGELPCYSKLSKPKRKLWISSILKKISEANVGQHLNKTNSKSLNNKANKIQKKSTKLTDSVYQIEGMTRRNISESELAKLNINNINDLLYFVPNRHNDFGDIRKVSDLQDGQDQTIMANVWEGSVKKIRPRLWSIKVIVGDDSGNVSCNWFRHGYKKPYLLSAFKPGTKLVISGKTSLFAGRITFQSPEYELVNESADSLVHTSGLVPVYPITEGITQRRIRTVVKKAVDSMADEVNDHLPNHLKKELKFMNLSSAIKNIHYPDSILQYNEARRRLAFDEFFVLQLAVLMRKLSLKTENHFLDLNIDLNKINGFIDLLPFKLTDSQNLVIEEILHDLNSQVVMNRLLQGDVGSGKTVVALVAMLALVFDGYQVALMAPTEILAQQHYATLSRLLSSGHIIEREENYIVLKLPDFDKTITMGILIGSMKQSAKKIIVEKLNQKEINIIVGTHALIQDDVNIPNMGLAVVDEQHRFGVEQRSILRKKSDNPHMLAMSATPIPRSLNLTVYGDLDISILNELPQGRKEIKTRFINDEDRFKAYEFTRQQVEKGRQAFVLCPLIEESEVLQTKAATEEYEKLVSDIYPEFNVGLLHGRMKLIEKDEVMIQFQNHDIDILVCTPVIEVGIDIPNASVMIIDGADRFGLAQLHQIRGRVGRGQFQSYCILIADAPSENAQFRLKLLEGSNDGFELAEEDLKLRGPGDYLGTRQSGLPNFKVAQISDFEILHQAREAASKLLIRDPKLQHKDNFDLSKLVIGYEERLYSDIN